MFRNLSRRLAAGDGVRIFKFDGFGTGLAHTGAGRFADDVDRLLWLADELREDTSTSSGGLWVTASTGSWPSPFWLMSADAIWRGGPDLGRQGDGSPRQQWITFRDSMVYKWVVQRAPLFPLGNLAVGGVVWSSVEEPGAYLSSYDLEDFKSEVRSYFISGVSLQELLIQPALLTSDHWDVLADAANKSRQYSTALRDAHWAGGDPAAGEVYGYASYGCPPCRGLISWRNPQGVAQNLSFTLRAALSLPRAWPGGSVGGRWRLEPIWPQATPTRPPQHLPSADFDAGSTTPAIAAVPPSALRALAAGASEAAAPDPTAAAMQNRGDGGRRLAATATREVPFAKSQRRFDPVALDETLHVELGAFELWVVLALPLSP